MSMLVPPQMINTMVPFATPTTDALLADPIRRYMIPVASDRRTDWPSHPYASRDSLHEHDMWVAEGLTHRYPTKVLAELLSTCPQYCGHCTRMDLVGNSTPAVDKLKLTLKPVDRYDAHISYLKAHPGVRDVVVSGGDVANVPWRNLESYLMRLLELETVRDIRLATKALMGLPQHWLQPDVVEGLERVARTAARRGVNLAIHTHVNHAQSLTPLVAKAAQTALDVGVRDVRNQGVLMRGVNATTPELLDLCFALQGEAGILPYYFYMCDMIPNAEHWRVPVWHAQQLQHDIMGYLPGYATPASSATSRSSANAGSTCSPTTTATAASPTGPRTTAPPSSPPTWRRSTSATPTTTRSTPCPTAANNGGPSTTTTDPPPTTPPANHQPGGVAPSARLASTTMGHPRPEPDTSPAERVTPIEVFFDVVFVLTITQLTGILEEHLSWANFGRAVLIFALLWYLYTGYAWLTNHVPPRQTTTKLFLLAGMAGFLLTAVALPDALADTGLIFAIGYLVVVVVHLTLFLHSDVRAGVHRLAPYNLGAALLVLTAAAFTGPAVPALWAAAVITQAALPYLFPGTPGSASPTPSTHARRTSSNDTA
ncbi:hypothetical protein GCM10027614_08070 [Micromonospora vulcania]